MSWIIILILIALGILFLLLELLIIPGTSFVGIIGLVALVLSVYQTFVVFGTSWGIVSLIGTTAVSIALLVLSLRSRTWKKAMLSTSINSKVNLGAEKYEVGDEGKSISRINPMGKAQFGNEYVEVSTFGDFIDPNSLIRIISIDQNKIYVEKIV